MILAAILLLAIPMKAERVTPETARKVATTFLNNNGAKTNQIVDLTKAVGFSNLYIFTAEEGFVVMSADDCMNPILGYSLTGTFVTEDMPENVRGWLEGYNDEIQYALDNNMRATAETSKLWMELAEGNTKIGNATVIVSPLIETKWNQNKYYNNLCPMVSDGPEGHAYTGCVATAMAQIMKYWEYPSKGIGSHSYTWNEQTLSADFNSTTYDWDNMEQYYNYYYSNGTDQYGIGLPAPTSEQLSAIATLMYHCGVSVDMSYGGNSTGGSGAQTSDAAIALKTYFNYSPDIEYKVKADYENSVWITMVKAELDALRPLEYSGRGSGGHAFVCDGYDNLDYFHFNWGWSGAYDGYFSLSNLNTGANNQSGQGNGSYTNDQAAVFGIKPSPCSASAPGNLTYTLSGLQTVNLTWDAATNATSYNIYRNNNLIDNTTTTSYSDTAPFGLNVYYVRGVDAEGNLSLSTNSVTVFVGYQTPIVDDLDATLSGNNVNLSWSAPDWCYPEYESAVLNYGTGDVYYSWTSVYYAHRHLAANLAQYAGKAVYKVSTLIQYQGTYSLFIYTKSTSNNRPDPNSLATNINGVNISSFNVWYDFDLSEPIILTGTDDLWVVIKQENTGQQYPTPSFNLTAHNTNAFYAGNSPTNLYDTNSSVNCAWFINTYLTDGVYTYNLYQDGEQIASNLSETTYSNAALNNNATNLFTVKTNYYGGETEDSNMIGFAKDNASLAALSLDDNDQMTVIENSILTVNSTLSSETPANLILENGSQLVNSSNGVQATVKKNIEAYTQGENDGWYLLASPIVESIIPTVENGILANDYDLYIFDQSENQEWRNYEDNSHPFTTIENSVGYLYANSGNPTLSFVGSLAASAEPVGLVYDANAESLGINLIGNPYPCNAYVDRSFYVLHETENGSEFTLGSNPIPPCTAILVQAQKSGESVTFNKTPLKKDPSITISVNKVDMKNNAVIDKAEISFNSSNRLLKYNLRENSYKLYILQDGREFAVAYANGANEMPVNFKATKNGTYTLSIEKEGVELDYLHLIDNLTGNDVDLLASPDYTFEAKTTDYASRFRLMFNATMDGSSTDSETFAYYANGEIRLVEPCHDASLQILDMMGRVVVSCSGCMQCVPTTGMTAGVYVLRLIDGENVKTQKIVIE